VPPLFDAPLPPTTGQLAPPRRRFRWLGAALAAAIALAMLPITFRYQRERLPGPEKRAQRMSELLNITQAQAIERFGKPLSAKDFSLQDGSFVGPRLGLKHFVPLDTPDYARRFQEKGAVAWTFPQFSVVREIIWKLPDSYLTIWLHQPRAEIHFQDGAADLTLPPSAPGEWVALDNYRIGKDLATISPR
jgi:hypothetical protein